MKKVLFGLAVGVLMSGCASASFVRKDFEPKRGGVVSYKDTAMARAESLKLAQKLMTGHCGQPGYKILSEGNETIRKGATHSMIAGTMYSVDNNVDVVNLTFECNL